MGERRRFGSVSRRDVARGALGGAFSLLVGGATRTESRAELLGVARTFLKRRVEYMADLSLALSWLSSYRSVAKSSAAVTAAHDKVRVVVGTIDVLRSDVESLLADVEGLRVHQTSTLSDDAATALVLLKGRADAALRAVHDFRAELTRPNSTLRRFDRTARGIEVET